MPKRHYSKKILDRINTLLADEVVQLDNWSFKKFLPSIKSQFEKKGSLTGGQYEHLVKLEEKFSATNKVKLLEEQKKKAEEEDRRRKVWEKKYLKKYQKDAMIVAQYYKSRKEKNGEEWFSSVYPIVLAGEIPSEKGCQRMLSNEYARKILSEWNRPSVFAKGDLVQPRKKYKQEWNSPLKDVEFAIVMKVNADIPSPASGGKKILILPKGNLKGLLAEERQVKSYKRKNDAN